MERINCYRCVHYFVTWEPEMPHGCDRLGFKSKAMPSVEVFKSSGIRCLHFEEKKFSKGDKAP
ncbi:uracil-DNA glycosylase [Limisalsivibrio acetivorans]|uniref:uracil-DNA glycosylase n=1 Tax=Limisalsivibrio acetivorans TaxID=1304888 RepID=UPI00040F4EFB|nr:uracil-DNA glycosylase [Limisalsivibrio acetivorans]